ncbi:MAG: GHKL domain-containing protein [Elusimicrobia bacterium]|nr:GHKL domain-containing protein [Elusimicrobiota bacterium]
MTGIVDYIIKYHLEIYPYGYFSALLFIGIIAYAIVRYRLMDITLAFTKLGILIVVYALVLGIPLGIGWRMFGFGPWVFPTGAAILLSTIGPFVYYFFEREAEARLLWEQRRYQKTLRQASAGMGRIRELDKLLGLISFILTRTVKIEHVGIYMFRKDTRTFLLSSMRRIKTGEWSLPFELPGDMLMMKAFRQDGAPLVYDELIHSSSEEAPDLARGMSGLHAALVFPIFIRSELMTIVVLGPKIRHTVYTEDDISVFTILGNQAALAIDNALFYQDMKQTQEQLFKAEKMATIGIMADGLSHQINNRLHAIGFVSGDMEDTLRMKRALFASPELEDIAQEFERGFRRLEENVVHGRNIVQGLMKYTRKGEEGEAPCEVADVLRSAWEMAQFKVKADSMRIVEDLPPEGLRIRGNFTQIQEVFFNLIDNAYDAMMQRKDEMKEPGFFPTLRVHAQRVETVVALTFKDNGIGVKPEDREKLFTPFFTTKATSRKGTGLGLYVIRKIVEENHGGRIEMESVPGEGTEFRIILPAAV